MTSPADLPAEQTIRGGDATAGLPQGQPRAEGGADQRPISPARNVQPLFRSLVVLFKARVVLLLLCAAVSGMILAAGTRPGLGKLALLVATGGSAAAGASAINQYLERGLDGRMVRTRNRPLVTGRLASKRWVPIVGILMILLPSLGALAFNPALAIFVLSGAGIYLGVYTIWLKPRSPINIVVGGLAGSAAVLSGSAAAGDWRDLGGLLLALLVFLWTPTHFWSLAIAYRGDYARGGFPMLPVQTTPRAAACWVLLNTVGTAAVALALATCPPLGWATMLSVGLASAALVAVNIWLVMEPSRRRALALFHGSNLYLATVLLMVCLDVLAG